MSHMYGVVALMFIVIYINIHNVYRILFLSFFLNKEARNTQPTALRHEDKEIQRRLCDEYT